MTQQTNPSNFVIAICNTLQYGKITDPFIQFFTTKKKEAKIKKNYVTK
jgi:hypothetical protein